MPRTPLPAKVSCEGNLRSHFELVASDVKSIEMWARFHTVVDGLPWRGRRRATKAAEQEALDEALMTRISQRVPSVPPPNLAMGQERLFAALSVERALSPTSGGERRMIGKLLTARGLAALTAAAIFAGGAATVGASGGVSGAAGNVEDVLATLHVTDRTPDQAGTHLDDITQPTDSGKPEDAGQPEDSGKPADTGLPNASEHAGDNAAHGLENATEAAGNAGEGINNAASQGLDHADDHALDGPASDKTPAAGLPPQANEHANDAPAGAPPPLPTQASSHADDRPDNPSGH